MEVSQAKALAMLSLGVGSFILGMAPAYISQNARRRHPLFISCLLCLGGGVLLSTALLHILPEAREKLPNYSELTLCIGFFLVYAVDEIVHIFYGENERLGSGGRYGSGEHTRLLGGTDGELGGCYEDLQNPMMCHVSHSEPCNRSSSGMIGLLCALFVHSLLEGLAIGLQESAPQVLLLLAAVASHKFVVAFCLGVELCESTAGRICMHIVCVTLFSGGSVAGIGIGGALNNVDVIKDSVAISVLQALAAGTLLYVTVSEVLSRERARWHERKRGAGIIQFIAVAFGFTLMYLLTRYLDHDTP